MRNVQITENALIVEGASTSLQKILVADAQLIDVLFPRAAIIFILCFFGPVLSMVLGTVLEGPGMAFIRWGSVILAGPGAVLLGIVISLIWKKPWAVVYEVEKSGYRSIRTENQEQAQGLAGEINKAIGRPV